MRLDDTQKQEQKYPMSEEKSQEAVQEVEREEKKPRRGEPDHPIAKAVDRLLNRVEDTAICASVFIPAGSKIAVESLKKHQQMLKEGQVMLEDSEPANQILGTKQILDSVRRIERTAKSELPLILEKGLFLSLFSAFDAFTGDILSAIYLGKPELFRSLNRSMTIAEMMKYESLEDLQQIVLQDEIEVFRRASYVEQFETLESRFGLKLRAFATWPHFVECSQRRNLITHCDGVISDQYINVCRREGYNFEKDVEVGAQIKIGGKYFYRSCQVMMEVGVKLGHTLWRKIFPEQREDADRHLNDIVYDFNLNGEWKKAQIIGEFINGLPEMSNDTERRIAVVNYAVALKFDGRDEEASKLIGGLDWSATSNEFKIAEAVLCDNFDRAAEIMKRIGKEGELIKEEAYHRWPLFRAFRESSQFSKAYQEVYGYPFVVELQKAAVAAEAKAEVQLESELHQLEDSDEGEKAQQDVDDSKAASPSPRGA